MLFIYSFKLPITEVFGRKVSFQERLVVAQVVSLFPDRTVRLPPPVAIFPRLQEAAAFPTSHKRHAELLHKDRVSRVLSVQAVKPDRNPAKVRLVIPLLIPVDVVHDFEQTWA